MIKLKDAILIILIQFNESNRDWIEGITLIRVWVVWYHLKVVWFREFREVIQTNMLLIIETLQTWTTMNINWAKIKTKVPLETEVEA